LKILLIFGQFGFGFSVFLAMSNGIFIIIFLARFENWKNQNGTFPKKAEKMPVFDTFLHFFALFYTFSHFFAPSGPFQKFANPFLKFLN